MIFTIVVLGAPYASEASSTAYRFCHAALEQGHSVKRVFFYGDAVHTGSTLITPPQDEPNLPALWQALIREHNLDAVICIAAALKRGVLDTEEQSRYRKSASNLAAGFTLSGLGQLIESSATCDRTITFGA
ncbi:sulfurtransferase complex subunit TusD [Gilvimarinus sp. DA14]|uniref:sulfurtransferase complex subunit TusD n=1 Tax=Gilvimarinus sp. DA14 TaxID=2956798 RepID=UPI0020B87033|nr:sulfurtransferase complex subunit TusD [Gilvimarinus sp. DA14]UTF60542.1 sulfurtransferase complex subunit TusD [Gilvimarinus sp. DA14]